MFDTEKYDTGFAEAILDWLEGKPVERTVVNSGIEFADVDDERFAPWNLL